MQDDDLFASEMSGVKPLNRDPRERLVKADRTDSAVRRQAAVASPSRSDNKLTDDGIPPLTHGMSDLSAPASRMGLSQAALRHYDVEAV